MLKPIEFENSINIISLVVNMANMIKNGGKYNYNMYIQKVYDETKDIVDNYFKILNDTKHFLEDRQKTLDEIIIFLENKRVDFRTIRCEVRTIVNMDDFYLKNEDYSNFMRGVLGVLQGGLESNILTDRGVENVYHNHTINDIIEECKRKKEYESDSNLIKLNLELNDAIEEQEIELQKSWNLVCESYIKISRKLPNRLYD